MEQESKREYEAPRIEDHGDLTELTAATSAGKYYDGNYTEHKEVVPDQTHTA